MVAPIASTDVKASGQFAPLDEKDWHELYDQYQLLALCEDRYMNSAGLNSQGVAQRLVLMERAGAIRADALRLLDSNSPLYARWATAAATQPDQQAQLIDQTLTALMTDNHRGGLGPVLARKAVARFYVAQVTGTVCPVNTRYQILLHKAAL